MLLALLLSTLALADTFGTLTVSGNKEDRNLAETAESATVLRENDLTPTGRENNIQVLNAVPNVEVNKNGESFSIRGINNTGVTGYQKDNLSSVILDGLFQTDLALQAGSFTLWDLDQIEVLRGAQSTNQGVNSLAGLVILNHQAPTFLPERGVRLGYGNYGAKDLAVYANQPLVEGKLGARVSAEKELNDGYITNAYNGNKDWGFWKKDRARLSLGHENSLGHRLNLDAKFHQNRQGGTYTQGSDPFRYEVNEDVDAFSRTRNYQLGSSYTRPLWGMENTASVGFSHSRQNSVTDADGTATNRAGARYETHRDHYLKAENQLAYRGERFENLFGFHAHDFRLKDDYDFNLLFPLGGTSALVHVGQGVDRQRRAYSLFDSALFRLNENHALVAGARAEYVESKYTTVVWGRRLENLGGFNGTVDNYIAQISGEYGGRQDQFVVLPKAGYQFKSGAHFSALTYTRGYRTSGVSINRRRATAVNYGPEFTDNFELAYRYSLSDLLVAANLFYIDWQDQQVQVQLSNDFYDTQVQNAAKSRVLGGELEGKIDLGRHNLGLGAGYADTKFRDFTSQGVNYEGKEFPFASKWTGRFTHRWNAFGNFTWLTTLRYVSSSFSNAENTRKAAGQFYLHGNARYALGQWVLEGYVNNVLNGRYHIFDGTPTSTTSPYQASYHQVSTPREYGMKVAYYW